MDKIQFIAYHRSPGQKSSLRQARHEGNVPSVIYGTKQEAIHVFIPAILFRDLVESHKAHFVCIHLEGQKIDCILQEVQYHPVAGNIIHADFLVLGGREIKMKVPLHTEGQAPGTLQGGKIERKVRAVWLKARPKDMPNQLSIDISGMHLGSLIKVEDLPKGPYRVLENPLTPLLGIQVPKALRGGGQETPAEGEADDAEEAVTETDLQEKS